MAVLLGGVVLALGLGVSAPAGEAPEPDGLLGPPPVLDPVRIDTLPFLDSASTCGRADLIEAPCAFLGGSPEVVYELAPRSDITVDIDLCASGFDTVLHVQRDGAAEACDDDGCAPGSRLEGWRLRAGSTYRFIVDGWAGSCGDYVLAIRESGPPCPVACPPAGVSEGEEVCFDARDDGFNSGCNVFPPVFRDLGVVADSLVVCGDYGTFQHYTEEHRDTDWFRVRLPQAARVECCVHTEARTQLALLDADAGCEALRVVCGSVFSDACGSVCCDAELAAGSYWIFVATRRFVGVPCGARYVVRWRVRSGTVRAEAAAWTRVKRLYR